MKQKTRGASHRERDAWEQREGTTILSPAAALHFFETVGFRPRTRGGLASDYELEYVVEVALPPADDVLVSSHARACTMPCSVCSAAPAFMCVLCAHAFCPACTAWQPPKCGALFCGSHTQSEMQSPCAQATCTAPHEHPTYTSAAGDTFCDCVVCARSYVDEQNTHASIRAVVRSADECAVPTIVRELLSECFLAALWRGGCGCAPSCGRDFRDVRFTGTPEQVHAHTRAIAWADACEHTRWLGAAKAR
jgi:hypothetical protein